jgi:DNA mismatch repair ATPase MutS
MEFRIQISKTLLTILNQVYEMEQKLAKNGDQNNLLRNLEKIKDALEHGEGLGLVYENPLGQPFNETRTDVEATISGQITDNLVVVEVIKPIIRAIIREGSAEISKVAQKGVVIVESRKENATR